MAKLFCIVLFGLNTLQCFAQLDSTWSLTFEGIYEDDAANIQVTNDGGMIVVGSTDSYGAGSDDVLLLKYDVNRELVWSRTYGGPNVEKAYSVKETYDDAFIIAGFTQSVGAGSGDGWLIKVDATGNELWSRAFGGSSFERFTSVDLTNDNGFIACGMTGSSGAGLDDFWLVKTDSAGNQLWSRTYGGSDYDQATAVVAAQDGGYALAGLTNSFGAGRSDFWLVKTDENGDSLWARTYGGAWGDGAAALVENNDGGFAVAGKWREFRDGDDDGLLIRTDANGDTLWTREFGWLYHDEINGIVRTVTGEYFMCGFRSTHWAAGTEEYWLVGCDANGQPTIDVNVGGIGQDIAFGITQLSNNEVVLAGFARSFGQGSRDVWLVGFGNTDSWITLQTPIGGEQWHTFETQWITWSSSGIAGNVNIRVNRNYPNGQWEIIPELQNLPNTGSASWIPQGAASNDCRIWIESAENHSVLDVGLADFSILRGHLNLTTTELEFGEVLTGTSVDSSVWITNDSQDTLFLSSVVSSNPIFDITMSDNFVPPHDARGIVVTFTASSDGFHEATLSIQSSTGPASVAVSGTGVTSANSHERTLPLDFSVLSAYPNPFNSTTTLAFTLSSSSPVTIRAYDVNGRLIEEIVNGTHSAGEHRVLWNCDGHATGMYLLDLSANGIHHTQRAILVR